MSSTLHSARGRFMAEKQDIVCTGEQGKGLTSAHDARVGGDGLTKEHKEEAFAQRRRFLFCSAASTERVQV